MESRNADKVEGRILADDEHWMVLPSSEKEDEDGENGTAEVLKLFREQMSLRELPAFAGFKPRGVCV